MVHYVYKTGSYSLTFVKESEFLHITRKNFRCPFLKVSFSFKPAAINETTSGWTASADTKAQDPIADRIANFTSSIPVIRQKNYESISLDEAKKHKMELYHHPRNTLEGKLILRGQVCLFALEEILIAALKHLSFQFSGIEAIVFLLSLPKPSLSRDI